VSQHKEQVFSGHIKSADIKTYVYLPVYVPENALRIEVTYQYDELDNVLDIGIFDERGIEFLNAGFRGWSGSARRCFYITPNSATPGYMRGPLLPGTWHVCLGLYEISEDGCDYQVIVKIEIGPTEGVVAQFPDNIPVSVDLVTGKRSITGWYKGDLHCHTFHSDGDSSPEEVVRHAESLGLDFLAIMDHNTQTQHADLNTVETSIILIPGYEVTTFHGHWNIWGMNSWIDFRIQTEADMRAAMQRARGKGYLVSCNHPRPYGPPWEFTEVDGFDCVEVWNGPWEFLNEVCVEFWEQRLRRGKRLPAVGGSDMHFLKRKHPAQLSHPTTWIYCQNDLSPAGLIAGIRAGHCFISESPDGPRLRLRAGETMMGDVLIRDDLNSLPIQLKAYDAKGTTLEVVGSSGTLAEYRVDRDVWQHSTEISVEGVSYIRVQSVEPPDRVRALTNPIYIHSTQNGYG
jgi:hypothetical protein